MNCFVKSVSKDEIVWKYTVKEEWMWNGQKNHRMHNLKLDSVTTNIECSCLLFEFRGILCRHSFLVLGQEDIKCVADKYVLRRWSKNV